MRFAFSLIAACAFAAVTSAQDRKPPASPARPKSAQDTDVKAILAELALPPIFSDSAPLARLSLSAAARKEFAADVSLDEIFRNVEKYPLRAATLRALQTVRDTWPLSGKRKLPSPLAAPVTDQAKKDIKSTQELLAIAIIHLEV